LDAHPERTAAGLAQPTAARLAVFRRGVKSPGLDSEQKGVLPPRLLKISLLAMTALHLLAPGAHWTALPGSLFGFVPIALGVYLNWSAARRFKRLGTAIQPDEDPSVLVTRGPFRLSRHPMYLGMALGLFGYAVLLGSLTPLLLVPAFLVLIDRRYMAKEEAKLEESFGEEYAAYRGKTARWV
jgi:protein-S-isoprenylcysteine O-methyltransferase Ste14